MSNLRMMAVTLLLVTCAGVFAQQADEKAVLDELAKRKVLDVEALKKRLDRLSTLGVEELEAELKLLQKEQDAVMEDWRKIDSLRRTKRPGVPPMELRSATFTMKLWQSERDREARLQALQEREEEAFQKRYKETLSKFSSKYKEWLITDEYRAFEKEKVEINKSFTTRIHELAEEAEHGNVEGEKALANLQRQIRDESNQIAQAMRRTSATMDLKTGKKGADAKSPPTKEAPLTGLFQRRTGPEGEVLPLLLIVGGPSPLPVDVVAPGEPVEVWVYFSGGRAPYRLISTTSEGRFHTERANGADELRMVFTFRTIGHHWIDFSLVDSTTPRNDLERARHEVMVIRERAFDDPPPPAKQDPPKPPENKPAEKKKDPPLLTPFSGTYLGELWIALVPFPMGRPQVTPTPVSLTFDTSGDITGRCSYTAPQSLRTAIDRSFNTAHDWTTRFTIQGKVDWQTGKIELRIPDGHIQETSASKYSLDKRTFDYSANVYGRHTSDPSWARVPNLFTGFAKVAGPGIPAVGTGPSGQPRFIDNGWFATEAEPGSVIGTVKFKSVKLEWKVKDGDGAKDATDTYNSPGGGVRAWNLKLLGPDTTAADLAKAELVGTSIWPDRKTTAKVGEPVHVTFVGVFGSNYTQIRDLTNIAAWQVPPGLQQVQPGVFRAAKAGEYTVRARAKGKDGNWMEGFVTINAVGS